MFDFLLGAGVGYLLAHYESARIGALFSKFIGLFK